MGINHKFRLSDMMPNAWFYKLRDMSKSRSSHKLPPPPPSQSSSQKHPRSKSLYHHPTATDHPTNMHIYTSPNNPKAFDTHFPPRKSSSSKKKPRRKTIYMPSPRKMINNPNINVYQDDSHFQESPVDFRSSPDDFVESLSSEFECSDSCNDPTSEFEYSCSCTKLSSSGADIIIDMDEVSHKTLRHGHASKNIVASSGPDDHDHNQQLPHGSTKPKRSKRNGRKSVSRSGGVTIRRSNSPKFSSRNIGSRKSTRSSVKQKGLFYSDSFAIVKASFDPERDFRESMMEMIVENNIRTSKELEELLACYLSLNSNQYHGLIIRAFEQVWFNMPQPIS